MTPALPEQQQHLQEPSAPTTAAAQTRSGSCWSGCAAQQVAAGGRARGPHLRDNTAGAGAADAGAVAVAVAVAAD